jgi:arylsulfatase B
MSERWRLVDGKELYDINNDPGQKRNVYEEHPDVVQKLTAWYDELWGELEPTFEDIAEIPIGDPAAKDVTLNYHDCIGRHMFWFQDGIRNLKGSFRGKATDLFDAADSKRPDAFWPINVVTEGEYTIELRRYPRERDAAISKNIPSGAPVYGETAHRTKQGIGFPASKARLSIGDQEEISGVAKDAKTATFRMDLPKGSQRLSAKFVAADGTSLDAFYVYARKSK